MRIDAEEYRRVVATESSKFVSVGRAEILHNTLVLVW